MAGRHCAGSRDVGRRAGRWLVSVGSVGIRAKSRVHSNGAPPVPSPEDVTDDVGEPRGGGGRVSNEDRCVAEGRSPVAWCHREELVPRM